MAITADRIAGSVAHPTPDPSRAKLSRRWMVLPALLLAAMAGVQAFRIHLQDVNSWADGPGFAMFAKVDAIRSRFPRLYLETDRGLERVAPYAGVNDAVHDLLVIPSDANGAAVAEALLAESWVRSADGVVPRGDGATGSPVPVRGVDVELWSIRVERETWTPYRKLVVRRGAGD